jgi:integrase
VRHRTLANWKPAGGLGPPANHALISLLALNGLRVSEGDRRGHRAPGLERGHRTRVITRKGGKVVTIPLAPRTARAIDLALGERTAGPLLLGVRQRFGLIGHLLSALPPASPSAPANDV